MIQIETTRRHILGDACYRRLLNDANPAVKEVLREASDFPAPR